MKQNVPVIMFTVGTTNAQPFCFPAKVSKCDVVLDANVSERRVR